MISNMSLIYITGPAGSGKTTTVLELRKRGYEAHDADDKLCGWYDANNTKVAYPSDELIDLAEWEDRHTFNFSDKLTKELAQESEGKLVFVCGNALGNDLEIADRYFDKIICLETDLATMRHRIKTRPAAYGKDPAVLAILEQEFQSTLERYSSHDAVMIDATKPIGIVTDEVIRVALENEHQFIG